MHHRGRLARAVMSQPPARSSRKELTGSPPSIGASEEERPARGRGGSESATAGPAHGPAGILSMDERRSADLDNERPYSAEIERRIADCEAGRPIGKTYTGEAYLEHLRAEHGIGA